MTYYWPCNSQNEWVCDATLLFLGIPEGLAYYWPITLGAVIVAIAVAVSRPMHSHTENKGE